MIGGDDRAFGVFAVVSSWGVSAIAMDLVTDGPIVAVNLLDPGAATPAAMLMRLGSNGNINTAFGDNGLADLTRAAISTP